MCLTTIIALLAHSEQLTALALPEQGPDLVSGVITWMPPFLPPSCPSLAEFRPRAASIAAPYWTRAHRRSSLSTAPLNKCSPQAPPHHHESGRQRPANCAVLVPTGHSIQRAQRASRYNYIVMTSPQPPRRPQLLQEFLCDMAPRIHPITGLFFIKNIH